MPFGSPTVQDRSGELIANGIANAFQTYFALRRQKKLDQERTEDRQLQRDHAGRAQERADLTDYERFGARRGTAPAEDTTVRLPDPESIPRQLDTSAPRRSPGFTDQIMAALGQRNALIPSASSTPASKGGPTAELPHRYEQVTDSYYTDRDAPGLISQRVKEALTQRESEARIGEMEARGKYYEGRADQPERATPIGVQLHERVMDLMNDGGFTEEEANQQARKEFGYAIPQPRTVGAGARNAESPEHRNARQGAGETRRALAVTRGDASKLEKQLSGPFVTGADSARVMPRLQRLRARSDSLQGAYDRQANQMTSDTPPLGLTGNPVPRGPDPHRGPTIHPGTPPQQQQQQQAPHLPPLTGKQLERARQDPGFRRFLVGQGYAEGQLR